MTEQKFRFHDPQNYVHVAEGQTYLIRPRLNPNDHWSVRNWLVLPIIRQPYCPDGLKSVSRMVIQNLTARFLTEPFQPNNPLRGFCYIVAQAIYYLMDTNRLDSWSGTDKSGVNHWWLVDRTSQEIIDLTANQYSVLGFEPPYMVGRKRNWYGFKPFVQKRTMDLIHQMQSGSSFRVVDKLGDL
jgi:hypothetical protein